LGALEFGSFSDSWVHKGLQRLALFHAFNQSRIETIFKIALDFVWAIFRDKK
jgi:hypothetical protein